MGHILEWRDGKGDCVGVYRLGEWIFGVNKKNRWIFGEKKKPFWEDVVESKGVLVL